MVVLIGWSVSPEPRGSDSGLPIFWCPLPRQLLRFGNLGRSHTACDRFSIVCCVLLHNARRVFRYDAAHFPEDLTFQETSDRSNFQDRYILRHPWTGTDECPAATTYRQHLLERYEREAQTLANLTGWNIDNIRKAMNIISVPAEEQLWYQRLWSNQSRR